MTNSREARSPCITPTFGFEAHVKLDDDLKTSKTQACLPIDLLLV